MSAVLCIVVRGFEEVGFYVLKVLAVLRGAVSAFLAYICGRSSNITIVREAVCRSCGRCGSNIRADGAFDCQRNVCGKERGIPVSHRAGGTGGWKTDYRFA